MIDNLVPHSLQINSANSFLAVPQRTLHISKETFHSTKGSLEGSLDLKKSSHSAKKKKKFF